MKPKKDLRVTPPKQQKSERERHYFDMFQKVYSLPSGTITYDDKPDVALKGAKKIGIEITNFYVADGSCYGSEQVQRVRRKNVVSKAQKLYEQATGNNFQLTFGFDEDRPIQDAEALEKNLVEFARRVEGGENGQISKTVFENIPKLKFAYLYAREMVYMPYVDPDFPDGRPAPSDFTAFAEYENRREARALREGIYRPLSVPAKWNLVQGHDFGLMSSTRLTEIVREKEVKARQYATCEAFWLLVVVDFIDSAQEQEIRVDGLVLESDVFERVIVYKPIFEHIVEVMPRLVNARQGVARLTSL